MRFLYADPDNFKNIREYTNSKLMGNVVDGETDADAAYLEAYPGTHLKTLIDFINEFRRTDAYQNLKEAITDSGATPQIGVIVGETNKTETIRDTIIYLQSKFELQMNPSYKIDWKTNIIPDTCSYKLFSTEYDSDIVINGGEYYGNSDNNYVTGNVISATNGTITIDGIDVIADSCENWFIYITTGTGSGQNRKINSNSVTSGGNTQLTLASNWSINPDATSDYKLTPMNEFDAAMEFTECKRIKLNNLYIHEFPGDGITLNGCEDVTITNGTIYNPNRWFYTVAANGVQNLVGRQAISVVTNPIATGYGSCENGYELKTSTGYSRKIRIENMHLIGGIPGALDLEPNGTGAVIEDVIITNCVIDSSTRGIAIENSNAIFKNIHISNTIIRNCYYGITLLPGSSSENIVIENVTFVDCDYPIYTNAPQKLTIKNCKFLRSVGNGIELLGAFNEVNIENNFFYRMKNWALYAVTGSNLTFNNNRVIESGYGNVVDYSGIYLASITNAEISNNIFSDEGAATQKYPMELHSNTDLIINNNYSYNHTVSDKPYYDGNYKVREGINFWGNTTRFRVYNTLSIEDTTKNTELKIGGETSGDTTALQMFETSRHSLSFASWRDVQTNTLGSKIINQNYATWSDPDGYLVQNANLLFYTLQEAANSYDNTKIRALITGNGLGLADSSYISFMPFNSASIPPDTLYRRVGVTGYGFRDNSGTIQYKNNGGAWTNISAAVQDSDFVAATIGTLTIDTLIVLESSDEAGIYYNKSNNTLFIWADSQAVGNSSMIGFGGGGQGRFYIMLEDDLVADFGCDEVIITEPLSVGEVNGDGITLRPDSLLSKWYVNNKQVYLTNFTNNKDIHLQAQSNGTYKNLVSAIGADSSAILAEILKVRRNSVVSSVVELVSLDNSSNIDIKTKNAGGTEKVSASFNVLSQRFYYNGNERLSTESVGIQVQDLLDIEDGATGGASMRLREGADYVGFKAPSLSGSSYIWTLPTNNAAGYLYNNGSGVCSWGTTVPQLDATNTWSVAQYFQAGFAVGALADQNIFDDATHGSSSTTMYIGNATIDVTASDKRHKNIISPATRGLKLLNKLNIVDYYWKDSFKKDKIRRTGLVAQELYKIDKSLAKKPTQEKNGLWTTDQDALIALLIKSVQELNDEVEKLKQELKCAQK